MPLRSDGSDDDNEDDEYDPTLMCRSTAATPQATLATESAQATRVQQHSSLVPLTASNVSSSAAAALVATRSTTATRAAGERDAHSAAAVTAGDGGLRLPCGAVRRGGASAAAAAAARVRCLAMSSAHAVLCAGADDGQLSMWDFATARTTRTLQPTRVLTPFVHRIAGLQAIVAMHASCDGAYFVVCQDGDSPALVQARNGKQSGYCAMGERGLVDVVRGKGHCAAVTSSSPHTTRASNFFTCAQDGTARLWDCNTCERGSRYAVQHGSGQLDDRVVVESVCSLTASQLGSSGGGGDGDVFATGGSDGCVQVWDARTRYRPGGALATWSVYTHAHTSTTTRHRNDGDDDVFGGDERHVGGLCEVACGGVAGVAVRVGDTVCVYDLRQLRNSSSSSSSGATRKGVVAVPLIAQLADTLPYTLDTTPLVRTRSLACHAAATTTTTTSMSAPHGCSMLTCTSRAGYRHIVGGHVLRLSLRTAAAAATTTATTTTASTMLSCVRAWRAGRSDEDVLCVCADTSQHGNSSSGDDDDTQLLCAGLSSGVVVVRTTAMTATASHEDEHSHDSSSSSGGAVLRCRGRVAEALQRWLASAPERVTGAKASRDDGDVDYDASKDEDALY